MWDKTQATKFEQLKKEGMFQFVTGIPTKVIKTVILSGIMKNQSRPQDGWSGKLKDDKFREEVAKGVGSLLSPQGGATEQMR